MLHPRAREVYERRHTTTRDEMVWLVEVLLHELLLRQERVRSLQYDLNEYRRKYGTDPDRSSD